MFHFFVIFFLIKIIIVFKSFLFDFIHKSSLSASSYSRFFLLYQSKKHFNFFLFIVFKPFFLFSSQIELQSKSPDLNILTELV